MIQIFRKIRYDLMKQNKTSKYLKYAIGEILLVMIGILLALQVGTWNEERKQQETLNAIYQITKEDLINDLIVIDSFTKEFEDIRSPAFEAVLTTNPTKEDWLKNPQYMTVIGGFEDFAIHQRGFELLKRQSNLSEKVEENLTSKINLFYNKHIIEIDVALLEFSNEFTRNIEYYKNYDWFSSYILDNELDGPSDFFPNNPIAKNRITWYHLVYSIYVEELKRFSVNAKELIILIDKHTNEN